MKTETQNRFVYQLTIRPAGPYTTPEGPGRDWHDTDVVAGGNGHGSVSYDAPLTLEQIQHYALLPVTQMRALNGQCFVSQLGKFPPVTHHVSLYGDCQALQLESDCNGRKQSVLLTYAEFCQRAKNWQATPFAYLTLGEPLPNVTPCPSGRNDCPSGCPKCPAAEPEPVPGHLLVKQEGAEPADFAPALPTREKEEVG